MLEPARHRLVAAEAIKIRPAPAAGRVGTTSTIPFVGDPRPPETGATAPGWYADPWSQAQWRWWDGRQWTGWTSPPSPGGGAAGEPAGTWSPQQGRATGPGEARAPGALPAARPAASPRAEAVPAAQRRRLLVELALVLAVFPLPYVLSAVADLVGYLVGNGPGARTPVLVKGHPGASFPLELLLIALPFAAAGLVAYLLSLRGAFGSTWPQGHEGGLRAIGLDRSNLRGDLALVIAVFVFCELIPIYGGSAVIHLLGLHGVTPGNGHAPGYFLVLDLATGLTSGIVEEIVVLGFLVRRLEQLNLPGWAVVLLAVAVRGSYHLYYGWAVLPILAWATVTVVLYRRYRRLVPFIVVHVLWDSSLFAAQAMPARAGGTFLLIEAGVLIPLSFVLFLLWRDRIPEPNTARR